MNMFSTIMIDFDGTLIDSESILFESWCKVYDIFGFKMNLDYWVSKIRPEKPHAAAYYALRDNMPDPPTPEVAQSLQKRFEKQMMDESVLRPGMKELLEYCKYEKKLKIALVTSSKLLWIQSHIEREHLQHYFDLVVSSESVNGMKKPDPSCFLYALSKLKCHAEKTLAIEDSPWGILAAKRAGLSVFAFPNNITKCMDLSASDRVIHNGMEAIAYDSKKEMSQKNDKSLCVFTY